MRNGVRIGLALLAIAVVITATAHAISPPPKPVSQVAVEPIDGLLRSARSGRPWQYQGLTIFPVRLSPIRSFGQALTLDEAAGKGLLTVSESGSGVVNRVVATNRSDRHVFLMAGEALQGAKQDRIISDDLLLPPRSRTDISVWCVEHGRWTEGRNFNSAEFAAPPSVRSRARVTKSQSEVWDSVAAAQREARVAPGSLATVSRSPAVQERVLPYKRHFEALPRETEGVSGVVVAYGNRWLAADVFYEPSLFRRLWPKLLDSYLMDVSGSPAVREYWSRPSEADAEAFLGRVFHARRISADTPGAGRRVEFHGDAIYGSALVFRQSVVHLEAFPGAGEVAPQRRSRVPSLEYRRDRLGGGARIR